MGVNNPLLKSIQTIVDKAIEIAPFDKTRQAQIIINNGDSSYTVRLDGILYNNVPSYPKTNVLEVGSIVKIVMPSNQSSQMYIQSSKGGSGGGDHKELTRAEYEALTPEQKNDGTVYFVTDGDPDYFIMSDSVPIGAIQAFGGETAPEGWLICDGSVVSRETYSDLFKVIGITYGSGDGSTTFNLPDLRGNVAIGVSNDYALGDAGGEKTHTLTIDEMPVHTHTQDSHNHTLGDHSHSVQRALGVTGSGTWAGEQGGALSGTAYKYAHTQVSGTAITTVTATGKNNGNTGGKVATNQNTGGGQAHNNMQPYVVTNYIIKAFQPPTDNIIKNLDPQSLVLDAFYPVGSCYETTNTQFNPNIVWGGAWEQEECFDDYIVDEGIDGIWTWRKWASGIAECWGKKTVSSLNTTAWGNWYYINIPHENYPTNLFVEVISAIGQTASPSDFVASARTQTVGGATLSTTTSPDILCIRPNAASNQSITGHWNIRGFWKTPEDMDKTYKWHRTA